MAALPIALVFGWWLGQRWHSRRSGPSGHGHSSGYARGLNYLLNDQPDRAIDLLVEMVEIDSEAVETHLALGALFRHQGEVERSIRIHQNLIARPSLSRNERAQAMLNLGLDFKQAGINDRAVTQFHKVITHSRELRVIALENLLHIHQHEKDWQQAIEVAQRLTGKQEDYALMICHFHCELVELAIAGRDLRRAAKLMRQASSFGESSPRFLLLQIKLAVVKQKNRVALRWLEKLITLCPEYRLMVLDDFEDCYVAEFGEGAFIQRIIDLAEDTKSSAALVCAIADRVERIEGCDAAIALLLKQRSKFSSILLNTKIIALTGGSESEGGLQAGSVSEVVGDLMAQMMTSANEYRCSQCGFIARQLHWRCPGCGDWQSLQIQEII